MADDDRKPDKPPLGVYERPVARGLSGAEVVAIALSAVWLLGSAIFFLGMGGAGMFTPENMDQLRFTMTLMAVFLPVAVIWVAASAARSARIVREESQRLQSAIDGMRQTYVADRQAHGLVRGPGVEKKIDEIVQAAKKTESAVATFTTQRRAEPPKAAPPPAAEPATDDQPALELGTPAEALAPPLETSDLISALNFPETADDAAGFASLRRALKDRKVSPLIQASQDLLTLLSQDGIYMDDLRPDRAKPEVWRRFAGGERGRAIAPLGGIRDRSSLALAAGRMRSDAIFRDTVHHFLRRFDTIMIDFCAHASDEEIAALADTRTARAFMLLGRVTGMFS
ncbi:MAG: hypothetical protein AAF618_01340 [Pseudomonadota bacterium]